MKKLFLLLALVSVEVCSAQVLYQKIESDIYTYLSDLTRRGIITFSDEVKPVPRQTIAAALAGARRSYSRLSPIEQEELEFYCVDYQAEIKKLSGGEEPSSVSWLKDSNDRYRLFSYSDSTLTLKVDPLLGYSHGGVPSVVHTWNGLALQASLGDNVGIWLDFCDNHINESIQQKRSEFSPEKGVGFVFATADGMDFDAVNGGISYQWKWGSAALMKDNLVWGSGRSGQLILSEKAPTFPFFQLTISPVHWLDFYYIHGYLNSGLIDSSLARRNVGRERPLHEQSVEKYLVAHLVTLRPIETIDLSLGESVVYSDRFEPIYLIPFLFFRMADHYLNAPDDVAGNAQVFANLRYVNRAIGTEFYSTLFIDEYSTSSFLNLSRDPSRPSAVGYTLGFETSLPFHSDATVNLEYTKINPMVYFHADDAQLYTNYGYTLGDWIGSNSDQLHVNATKKILRGLKASLTWDYVRKGQEDTLGMPRYQPWQTFLYGLKKKYSFLDFAVSYEPVHSLIVKAGARQDVLRREVLTGEWAEGKNSYFYFSLSYGL